MAGARCSAWTSDLLRRRLLDEFLRKLARRGLRGVKLVIADAHEGIEAAIGKVFHAAWQRCRVHFMRNVLAHGGRQGRRVVAAIIKTIFVQDDAEAASKQWKTRSPISCVRKRPRLAELMDETEADVLAYMSFPKDHRLRSTPQSVGTPQRRDQAPHRCRWHLPQRRAITRLVGALLLEQNDEWAVQGGAT